MHLFRFSFLLLILTLPTFETLKTCECLLFFFDFRNIPQVGCYQSRLIRFPYTFWNIVALWEGKFGDEQLVGMAIPV